MKTSFISIFYSQYNNYIKKIEFFPAKPCCRVIYNNLYSNSLNIRQSKNRTKIVACDRNYFVFIFLPKAFMRGTGLFAVMKEAFLLIARHAVSSSSAQ